MAGIAHLVLAFGLLLALVVVLRRIDRGVSRRLAASGLQRHGDLPPAPLGRPVQLVAADLRRLRRQLAAVPAGAPLLRWQALWSAYDDVLGEAAAALDVPHELPTTSNGPARDLERLRLLAALEGAGLVVRD